MLLAVDHLIIRAPDLESGSAQLADRLGVGSVEGGRHIGFGTHNAIVPLGSTYLEILAVYDVEEAASNPFGRWAMSEPKEQLTVDALVLRTDDLDAICERNGLTPVEMSRVRPDGFELSWRLAGMKQGVTAGLPAFIQWDVEDHLLPGAMRISHPGGKVSLRAVEIEGDVTKLDAWTGQAQGVSISAGDPGFSAVFDTDGGPVDI